MGELPHGHVSCVVFAAFLAFLLKLSNCTALHDRPQNVLQLMPLALLQSLHQGMH